MITLEQIKFKLQVLAVKILVATMNEIEAQKNVWRVLKSEVNENLIQGFKTGRVQAEFMQGCKELFDPKAYKLGLRSQDLHNKINIQTYTDRSLNAVGGRKYGFVRVWANRWGQTVKSTQLLRSNGLINLRSEEIQANGVQYPPRYNRALDTKHYLHYSANV